MVESLGLKIGINKNKYLIKLIGKNGNNPAFKRDKDRFNSNRVFAGQIWRKAGLINKKIGLVLINILNGLFGNGGLKGGGNYLDF